MEKSRVFFLTEKIIDIALFYDYIISNIMLNHKKFKKRKKKMGRPLGRKYIDKIDFAIEPDQYQKFMDQVESRDTTKSALARAIIIEWLQKQSKKG